MTIQKSVTIQAPQQKVWDAITDIPNLATIATGIDHIEILLRPTIGIEGLKWAETRKMFGQEASEVIWITQASPPHSYKAQSESHDTLYETLFTLEQEHDATRLTMRFEAHPQTFVSRFLGNTVGLLFRGITKKVIFKDLDDIKTYLETTP